ncbi:laccase domain-containing protein [Luteimonas composti]|uniref:Laccase domain-containing protein n=1 Tax=Luteimonas composti TaxID=398257 RepID=A0ABT6MS83_9GAMM|nr:laccase domain-containing protein [Luteimonas composti]MDH7453499.1 laccase domain-containing protein [Luteimonas composti]
MVAGRVEALAPPGVPASAPFPANVRAFTTLRHGAGGSAAPFDSFNLGNFRGPEGDDPETVARNRAELVARFGLPSWPHWLRQVHGTRVLRFDAPAGPPPQPSPASGGGSLGEGRGGGLSEATSPSVAHLPPQPAGEGRGRGLSEAPAPGLEPEADASVTSAPGVVLAILTADCLPVVFAARDGSELAVAHAGWPGLSKGMLEATLAAMRTPPRELVAWIGPCAGPARYEVGRNVFDAFVGSDPGAAAAFSPVREGHWLADLPALARRRLAAAGMRVADIHGGDLCTISWPDRFFSHRRDGRSGRIATLAWIAPGG